MPTWLTILLILLSPLLLYILFRVSSKAVFNSLFESLQMYEQSKPKKEEKNGKS